MLGSAHSPGARGVAGADAAAGPTPPARAWDRARRPWSSSSCPRALRAAEGRPPPRRRERRGTRRPPPELGAEIGRDHERLARPQGGEGAPDVLGGRGERPPGRGQRHAGRHQDGHEDHRDEEHGGARRAEAAVQRAADGRAEIPAGVLRARPSSRSAATPWPARPGRRCRARRGPSRRPGARGRPPRAPRPSSSSNPARSSSRASPAPKATSGSRTRTQPATRPRPVSTPWPMGPSCLPQRASASRTPSVIRPDGPQVTGLAPPERRPRRRCRRPLGPARRLLGGTGGGARRGAPAGLGHHSAVEITG